MNKGLTLIEVIISLGILGFVVTPLMSIFVLSANINSGSSLNYKALITAQRYIEEVKVLNEIITDDFNYNLNTGVYEKIVPQTDKELGAEVRVRIEQIYLYVIEVFVVNNGEVIYSLSGSKIVN